MIQKIFLASPRGFCAGVKRAVNIVDLVLKKHGPPIYVRHQIVHNRHVIADFEKKGVIFKENMADIPDKSVVIFSSHGSPASLYQIAKKKNLIVYDAVCPLVIKVHLEAKRYAKEGYFIFYIGHKGHPEGIGVLSEVPKQSIALVETVQDIEKIKLKQKNKLIVLTQTTMSFDDTKELINTLKTKFPKLILPPVFDICYATQNRQNAVKELAKKTKIILVVGSKESSNSNRLREVAQKQGAIAYLIDGPKDIDEKWIKNQKTVGITAGASAPNEAIDSVIKFLSTKNTICQEVATIQENINFPYFLEPVHL